MLIPFQTYIYHKFYYRNILIEYMNSKIFFKTILIIKQDLQYKDCNFIEIVHDNTHVPPDTHMRAR